MNFEHLRDKQRIAALASKQVLLGTSTWTYPGWRGQVYLDDYSGPKKDFVESRFLQACLKEYATIFPTVCFDGMYWRLPDPKQLQKFAAQMSSGFKMSVKCTNIITGYRTHDHKSGLRGSRPLNPSFLDPEVFREEFYAPLVENLGDKLGSVIFEFSPFRFDQQYGPQPYRPLDFIKVLHSFFEKIPKDLEYAVEVRDPVLVLDDSTRYLKCLKYHGVAHCLNEHTWMPTIHEQLEIPDILTADHSVVRALEQQGMKYAEAGAQYAPFDRTHVVLEETRSALALLIDRAIDQKKKLSIYVGNNLEGNAPNTIAGTLDAYDKLRLQKDGMTE